MFKKKKINLDVHVSHKENCSDHELPISSKANFINNNQNTVKGKGVYLHNSESDTESCSDHELPISSIANFINNNQNTVKGKGVYLHNSESDTESCSDHELPISSIANFININQNTVKRKEIDLHNRESDTESVSDYDLSLSSITNVSTLKGNRKIVSSDVQKTETIEDDKIKTYKCDICKTTFHKRSLIIKHFRTSVCFPDNPKSNNTKNSMFFNNDIHSSKQACMCKICGKLIENSNSMKNIEILCTEKNRFKYDLRSKFKRTHRNTHLVPEKNKAKCKTCGESFINLLLLKAHRCNLPEINDFFCKKCYINICAKEESKIIHTYNCHICHKQFSKMSSLVSHKICKTKKVRSNSQCKLCNKYFSSESSVSKHISRVHASLSSNYECVRCSKTFHDRSQIVSHLFESHLVDYSKYSCNACSNLYECPQEFIFQVKQKVFSCEICPQLFTTPYRLNQHYKWHLGINHFKCQYCSEIFFEFACYYLHEQTHTREKPLRCYVCGKYFPISSDLNIHLTFFDEKKFKSMSGEIVLNQGLNKNKMEEPYKNEKKCVICKKIFQEPSQTVAHILEIHF